MDGYKQENVRRGNEVIQTLNHLQITKVENC
jgi:hypothetical protein